MHAHGRPKPGTRHPAQLGAELWIFPMGSKRTPSSSHLKPQSGCEAEWLKHPSNAPVYALLHPAVPLAWLYHLYIASEGALTMLGSVPQKGCPSKTQPVLPQWNCTGSAARETSVAMKLRI